MYIKYAFVWVHVFSVFMSFYVRIYTYGWMDLFIAILFNFLDLLM